MRKEIFFGRMGFSFLRVIFVWKPKISYRTIPKGKYLLENERSTNVFVRAPQTVEKVHSERWTFLRSCGKLKKGDEND